MVSRVAATLLPSQWKWDSFYAKVTCYWSHDSTCCQSCQISLIIGTLSMFPLSTWSVSSSGAFVSPQWLQFLLHPPHQHPHLCHHCHPPLTGGDGQFLISDPHVTSHMSCDTIVNTDPVPPLLQFISNSLNDMQEHNLNRKYIHLSSSHVLLITYSCGMRKSPAKWCWRGPPFW